MSTGLLAFLAFLPILVAMILLLGLGWGARQSMPVGYVVAVIVGLAVWKMNLTTVVQPALRSVDSSYLLWISGALLLPIHKPAVPLHSSFTFKSPRTAGSKAIIWASYLAALLRRLRL